jgi:hypothetical protein
VKYLQVEKLERINEEHQSLKENAKLDEGMQKKDLKEMNMVEVVDLEALVNNSHC